MWLRKELWNLGGEDLNAKRDAEELNDPMLIKPTGEIRACVQIKTDNDFSLLSWKYSAVLLKTYKTIVILLRGNRNGIINASR